MQTVATLLQNHCSIPSESYFLAAHMGKGKFAFFAGPHRIPEEDLGKVFRREKFLQLQKAALLGKAGPWLNYS